MILFVRKSSNKKTGPIPVTISSKTTCPPNCKLKRHGCYAETGPLALHWAKVDKVGISYLEFYRQVDQLPAGQIWRHNQAGDLLGSKGRLNKQSLQQLAAANKNKKGFTYTQYPVLSGCNAKHNRKLIKEANDNGFTINLSGIGLEHADQLADLNIAPVTVVIPSDIDQNLKTPAGRTVILCPATTNDYITCQTCKLCAKRDRKFIIGFKAHGCRQKKIDKALACKGKQ